MQRGRFGAADVAGAVAARAGDVTGFGECGAQALARQLEQAEAADLAGLHAGAVVAQGVAQAVFDFALVARRLHVDEVDHDQAAKVAQAQLAGNFVGGLAVGAEGGFLDVRALGGAARVDVDRHQRLGVVDHYRAARGQVDLARVGRLDLVFDLEAREQWHVVVIALDARDVARHHVGHELGGLLVDVVGVDEDFTDVGLEVIADRADHQAAFLIDQEGTGLALRCAFDRTPQLEQVVEVPLQFFGGAADRRGARDHAHAGRDFELVHGIAQFGALVTLDPARHATATRVVGHQHEVAAGQRDVGGERRALVAAFVLFHLDDQFLAFAQGFLDRRLAGIDTGLEVAAGDFLERQEAVALGAVIDESRFEAGLDAGDHGLVDVALAFFLGGRFDIEIDQFLTVYDRDAQFFGLRRIEKHALHLIRSPGHHARAGRTARAIALSGVQERLMRASAGIRWVSRAVMERLLDILLLLPPLCRVGRPAGAVDPACAFCASKSNLEVGRVCRNKAVALPSAPSRPWMACNGRAGSALQGSLPAVCARLLMQVFRPARTALRNALG